MHLLIYGIYIMLTKHIYIIYSLKTEKSPLVGRNFFCS